MTHYLKIKRMYYNRILDGVKPWEVRFNDRDYQAGDEIYFEIIEANNESSYQKRYFKIKYVHSGLGMAEGFVVLTIEEFKK